VLRRNSDSNSKQEVERERQRVASIEQQQKIEEHQEALNGLPGPSRKRKRTPGISTDPHIYIPSCLEEEYPLNNT
jgi:hypothetical protein